MIRRCMNDVLTFSSCTVTFFSSSDCSVFLSSHLLGRFLSSSDSSFSFFLSFSALPRVIYLTSFFLSCLVAFPSLDEKGEDEKSRAQCFWDFCLSPCRTDQLWRNFSRSISQWQLLLIHSIPMETRGAQSILSNRLSETLIADNVAREKTRACESSSWWNEHQKPFSFSFEKRV